MVVKFTFQSVFGNSLQNPRHFSARGREESLELYSILWSDWPTSKQEVLRHGNRFAARVRRRYFSEGEKRRPEMRLRFAGYQTTHWPPLQRLPYRLPPQTTLIEQTYLHCASYRSINSHHLVFHLFHRPSLFLVLLHSFLATSQHAVSYIQCQKKCLKIGFLKAKTPKTP